MASIAGSVCSVGGFKHARCFRENRALNLRARGISSEVSIFLRLATVATASDALPAVGRSIMICEISITSFHNAQRNFLSQEIIFFDINL